VLSLAFRLCDFGADLLVCRFQVANCGKRRVRNVGVLASVGRDSGRKAACPCVLGANDCRLRGTGLDPKRRDEEIEEAPVLGKRLFRQPEPQEEQVSAGGKSPLIEHHDVVLRHIHLDEHERDLLDHGKLVVRILPGDPGDLLGLEVQVKDVDAQGEGEEHFAGRETQQAEVLAHVNSGRVVEGLAELAAGSQERSDRETGINERRHTYHDGPHQHKWNGKEGRVSGRPTPKVLEDIVPVTLDNVGQSHYDHWQEEPEEQIGDNSSAPRVRVHSYALDGRNVV